MSDRSVAYCGSGRAPGVQELATFAAGAEKLLQTALKYGKVVLCTNAESRRCVGSVGSVFAHNVGELLVVVHSPRFCKVVLGA